MAVLQFNIVKIPEGGFHLEESFPIAEVKPGDVESLTAHSFNLQGFLAPMGDGFLFRGELEAEFQHPCDRCLEMASKQVTLEVVWSFEEGPVRQCINEDGEEMLEEDYPEFHSIDGGILDVGVAVWEELVFNAPTKYTCDDDCKGLCPQCGINLNTGDCACDITEPKEPEANRGLAGLADLFPDLAPGQQEE